MTTKISSNNLDTTVTGQFGPKISGISVADSNYTVLDDTAVSVSGGYIVITGSNFVTGCTVLIGSVVATSVSFISSTTVRAQVPAQAAGSYTVYLTNPDGGVAIRVLGLNYSATPTWSTTSPLPTAQTDAAINIQLSASSNTTVTYALQAGSSLPAGLTLSNVGLLSGTVTGLVNETTYNFTVVATDVELQDTPQAFSITISVGDQYWNLVTTLISPAMTALPFVDDASTNNFAVTVNGDTRPYNFNPYTPGYYSNYFNGSTDYLSIADSANLEFGSGTITVECWFYMTGTSAYILDKNNSGTGAAAGFSLYVSTTTVTWYYDAANNGYVVGPITTSAVTQNAWHHIACVRSVSGSTTNSVFVDGVRIGTSTTATAFPDNGQNFRIGATFLNGAGYGYLTGYVSNVRFVKGTAVYDPTLTTLTVPTSPLTAITNTQLLTCQSNRFIDNSTNAFAVTLAGAPTIQGFIPYTPSSSYSTYGSAYFDGTGDYLSWSGTSIAGDFTAEAWVYPTANDASGYCVLYGSSAANNQLYYNASTGAVGLVLNATTVISATGTAVKINAWNHIAFVRSGSTCTIYVNGASTATGTNSSTFNLAFLGTYAYTAFGYEVNGYVTDARIVNGTAVYTGAFTPPTTPLTAIANTSLLTCQTNQPVANNTFIDNSTNNFAITRNGNTAQGTFSPYGAGWSNYFDGTGDYLSNSSDNAALRLGSGDFTLEFWMNCPASATALVIYDNRLNTSNNTGGFQVAHQNGTLSVYGGATTNVTLVSGTITHNIWNHIAIVRSGSGTGNVKLYINGALASTYGSADTNNYVQGYLNIGCYLLGGTASNFYIGYISNFRMVKGTALYTTTFLPSTTPLQPVANTSLLTCQSPNIVDNSPNAYAITRNGDTSVQRFSPFPATRLPTPYYGASFNGTTDYLTTPSFSLTLATWTMEFWLYTTSTTQYQTFVHRGNGATWGVTSIFDLYMSGTTTGTLVLLNGTGGTQLNGTTQINNGVWHHVAVTYDGTNYRLFVDGKLDAYQAGSAMSTASYLFYIGYDPRNSRYASGYISNFRFVDGSVVYPTGSTTTGSTIFTPPTTPLTAITNTSLLTCQSNTFIDNSTNNFTITAATTTVKPTTFNPFTVTYSTKQSYTPSVYGGSMYFDGTGDYLSSPSPGTTYQFGTGNWTIEAWVYSTSTSTTQTVFDVYGTTNDIINLQFNGTTLAFFCEIRATNQASTTATSTVLAALNSWNHVAVVRDSTTTVKLYVNGILGATATIAATTTFVDTQFSSNPTIGAKTNTVTNYMVGYISDLRVIRGQALYTSNFVPQNTPLAAVKNTVLLLNGTGAAMYDSAMTSALETVGDTKLSTNIAKYSGSTASMYFDGTGDYLITYKNTSVYGAPRQFTAECWVYITNTGVTSGIMGCWDSTAGNAGWTIWCTGTAFKLIFGSVSFNSTWEYPNLGSVSANTWTHIAFVRTENGTNNVMRFFVNGTSVLNIEDSNGDTRYAGIPAEGYPFGIGVSPGLSNSRFSGTVTMNGYISEPRITRGYARYTSNFTVPSLPLPIK